MPIQKTRGGLRPAVLAAALLGTAPVAHAQAYIGIIAGQMAAQQQAAAAEAACRAGKPASERAVTTLLDRMNRVMAAYFALTPKSDDHAIWRIFSRKVTGVRWLDAADPIPPDRLGDHLAPPASAPVVTSAVVGGDAMSGRGVWSVTGPDGAPLVYAVDFYSEPHGWADFASGLRITRLSVSSASPPAPGAFCHIDSAHTS